MTEFGNEKNFNLVRQVKLACWSNFSAEKALEC